MRSTGSATAEPISTKRAASERVRRPVAVVVSRFPLVTETFIVREIDEMERQGQPVVLASLLRERPEVVHRAARPWIDRLLHAPLLSPPVVASNLRAAARDPARYLSTAVRALRIAAPSWNFLIRTAALLPTSVHLAERLRELDVRHVHAHFATHPTTVALVCEGLGVASFSFTAHAHDLFVRQTTLGEKTRRAAFVRVISAFNREFLAERFDGAREKTRVIHMGIDPDRHEPAAAADPDSPPTVLCVAALKPYKGVPVLLEACALLRSRGRELRCRIVGDGPDRVGIEDRIEALGIGDIVELLGARTEDEVARLLAEADVCALPSVVGPDGQMDGIPVFLMEAMAARKPVVASDLSGIPELVEDGETGLLVPPGDPHALADALGRALADDGLARRLAVRGRERIEREFRLEACAARLVETIDRVNPPAEPAAIEAIASSDWPGLPGSRVGVRRVRERADSRIVELLVTDGDRPREVVMKTQRSRPGESRPPGERAAREHALLVELEGWFADAPGLGVPRALHLDEGAATLVVERCPGRSLDERIRDARAGSPEAWREAERAAAACGAWLARFQARPVDGDPAEALARLVERATADLPAAGLADPEAARRRLHRLAAEAAPGCRIAPVHGDFWPGNVFVGEGRLEVIDFEGARSGMAWEDPAWWLVHAELFLPTRLLERRWRSMGAAFLDAWLGDGAYDPAGYRLCRTAAALRALARSDEPRGLADRLRRRTLRRIATAG